MKKLFTIVILIFSLHVVASGQRQFTAADSAKYPAYWWHSKDMFDNLPDIRGEIIFLGNSITDGGEWFELLENKKCLNRGISGDVTEGILLRLDGITRVKPSKIFLMIGVNDLSRDISVDQITENYRLILKKIKAETPGTKVYIESVLPVNPAGTSTRHRDKTDLIIKLNVNLKTLAAEYGYRYVDLFSVMADKNNYLPKKYSIDGLHLTYEGYKVWVNTIRSLVNE